MSPEVRGAAASLLLDEMFAPAIAERLSARGVACIAVVASPELRSRSDADLLTTAVDGGHVLVTNNVGDFEALRRQRLSERRAVPGIIYTSDRAFPRDRRFTDRIVDALADAVARKLVAASGGVLWLAPPDEHR